MVPEALMTFTIATVLFLAVAIVVQVERVRMRRLFLAGARGWLDRKVAESALRFSDRWHHFSQYIVKLGWYYSLHSLLRTVLAILVSIYNYFEDIFEKNRSRTKQLRQERKRKIKRSHLTEIADHKVETALTPAQQTELRRQKLEDDQ
ncbi:MAG TPA: hypothetical protein VGE31_00835 [Candidatus Paceibacterota bacterium]